MTDDAIKQLADQILADLKVIIDEFKALQGFDPEAFFNIITEVVKKVEQYAGQVGGLTSEGKKDLAVEVLNKIIDIPYLPEWIEAKVISLLIDFLVNILNKHLGKDWLEKI